MTYEIERLRHWDRKNGKTLQVVTGVELGNIVPPTWVNEYVVEVEFMIGDADGYPKQEVTFQPGDEARMIEFLNFLCRCAVEYPTGKGGYDSYKHVEGYKRWVGNDDYDEDYDGEYDDDGNPIDPVVDECEYVLEWPMEEWEYYSSFIGAKVYFYNEQGVQHYVNLV